MVAEVLILGVLPLFLILRILFKTSLLQILVQLWRSVEDRCHVYQFFTVPQFNEQFQENQLYRKVAAYLSALPSLDDSKFTHLMSGSKPNDVVVRSDPERPVLDRFLGATVSWQTQKTAGGNDAAFVLKIKKRDKRRIMKPYLQHIFAVSDEVEQKGKEIRLFMNIDGGGKGRGSARWRSVPFNHPAMIDTITMDADLKSKVKADLESFLKSKQFYHRLGRVWKRSYLLHGASGTGKTSFIAAMANLLHYDLYTIDLLRVSDDSDLKLLLMQTTSRSIIVVEDLDRFLSEKPTNPTALSLSGVLNFMDGLVSCCGDERVMVFTVNGQDRIDESVMRPGRIDVHIHFPLCDFGAFKSLATSYLGVKEHKLFPQVEEIFQTGASLSPAHIGEIMISNRGSPSRALKSIITALQTANVHRVGQRLSGSGSGRSSDDSSEPGFGRESGQPVRDFKKLYGLLKMGSRRKESMDLSSTIEKEGLKNDA